MSAAAPVRCTKCGRVAFAIVHGIAEGKCCGQRITAERRLGEAEAHITGVDRPERRLVESPVANAH